MYLKALTSINLRLSWVYEQLKIICSPFKLYLTAVFLWNTTTYFMNIVKGVYLLFDNKKKHQRALTQLKHGILTSYLFLDSISFTKWDEKFFYIKQTKKMLLSYQVYVLGLYIVSYIPYTPPPTPATFIFLLCPP